jgi:hypothetical protein
MKARQIPFISFIFLFIITAKAFSQKWTTKDFSISLHEVISQPENIFVNSGYTTVRPALYSLFGVADFFSAPFGATDFRFSVKLKIDGIDMVDAGPGKRGVLYRGGTWQPDVVVRQGLCYRVSDTLNTNLKINTELYPLYGKSGFLLKAVFQNNGEKQVKIDAQELIQPGNVFLQPLNEWTFGTPNVKTETKQTGDATWEGRKAAIRCFSKNKTGITVPKGEQREMYWSVVIDDASQLPAEIDFEQCINQTKLAWQRRLDTYLASVPHLKTDIDGLDAYYKRSLVSGLVCIWEKPGFLSNPYLSTSGMDGGAMNCYLWDLSYAANMISQLFGKKAETILQLYARIDLEKSYAFTPGGDPSGVGYAYSPYSFTYLVSTLARFLGPNPGLYEEARRLTENVERRVQSNGLVDFGRQDNLLEMKSSGYEHFVVSPNAERAASLRYLADLHDRIGLPKATSNKWRLQADTIDQVILDLLWDESKGWFRSLYPTGHAEMVYSIQVFDAIGTGLGNTAVREKVIAQLDTGRFLSDYGVSSISAKDSLHYEYNDPDWGGSGAYTGDGPQLAQMLYGLGENKKAWDVLKRFFWMGKHLAYFPQEHYVDKPIHPAHKRSNVIAGLMGAEVVLYSLIGFVPHADGSLWLNPKLDNASLSVEDYKWKNVSFSISFANGNCTVMKDGKQFYKGKIKKLQLH